MKSLNALLKQIQGIAESHSQINKYAQGQRYDFGAEGALTYPCLWAVPNGVTVDLNLKTINYSIILILMDLETAGGENQIEILSDTVLILTDVLSKYMDLLESEDEEAIFSYGRMEPFVDAQLDTVSGHSCEIVISAFFDRNDCTAIFNN